MTHNSALLTQRQCFTVTILPSRAVKSLCPVSVFAVPFFYLLLNVFQSIFAVNTWSGSAPQNLQCVHFMGEWVIVLPKYVYNASLGTGDGGRNRGSAGPGDNCKVPYYTGQYIVSVTASAIITYL